MTTHLETKSVGADVLRGLAILMVFIYHAFGPVYFSDVPWDGWFRNFDSLANRQLLWYYPITFGWSGVALFFVLSGFCIHYSFLRSRCFDVTQFFYKRFWRIYPAYVMALLFFTVLEHINILSRFGAEQFLSHALFLHNFRDGTFFGINPSFWSIATEVQLYLLFPLFLVIRSRYGVARCLYVTFFVGVLWRAVSIYCWGLPDHLITPALSSPLMTWFDWALGAFVAEKFFRGEQAFGRKKALLLLILPLFVASTLFKPSTTFSFSLAAVASAVILDGALHFRWRSRIWVKSLAFIGGISYSLYLWHQPLLFRVTFHIERLTGSPIVAWFALLPLMIAGSWVSFRIFEQIGIKAGEFIWKLVKNSAVAFDSNSPKCAVRQLPSENAEGPQHSPPM